MRIRWYNAVLVAGAVVLLSAGSGHALTAATADDVCASDADPCHITEPVDVADGAVLDFQTRTVNVTGAGQLNFGVATGTILSGAFHAATSGPAIRSRVAVSPGRTDSGSILISTRRLCSDGGPVPCADDADCDLGTCSVGDGAITIAAGIDGRSDDPARITLRAAGSVAVSGDVDLSSTSEYEAGRISLEALDGNATVGGSIRAKAGRAGSGGRVSIEASQDAVISAPIDLTGENLEDGIVELSAGRDVAIAAKINVSARTKGGWGGQITAVAGRDILIDGDRRVVLLANGAGSGYFSDDGGGNGGLVELDAGGDVTVAEDVRILANGAVSNGAGGSLFVTAGGDVELGGRIAMNSSGTSGGWLYVDSGGDVRMDGRFSGQSRGFDNYGWGGYAEIYADGDFTVSESGELNLTGADGGALEARIRGSVDFRGHVDASGRRIGYGGYVELYSDHANVDVSGVVETGGEDGDIEIDACSIEVSGTLSNSSSGGYTGLTAFDSLTITADGSVRTPGGQNSIRYGHADNPPVILGNVSPAAQLVVGLGRAHCP